jgi:hypothetical protein
VHEDAEVEKGRWDAETTDVFLDERFAVEMEDFC